MGHQSENNKSGSKEHAPQASQSQASQSDPQNKNRNDNNVADSNKPDNLSAQQNTGSRDGQKP